MSATPVLFLALVLTALSQPGAKETEVREAVFLGQLYPSGRIYLRQFPSQPKTPAGRVPKAAAPEKNLQYSTGLDNPPTPLEALKPWPREVIAINTDPHNSLGTKVTRAWLVKVLVDGPPEKKNHLGYATEYIPGLEGMDSTHYPCGLSTPSQDTNFTYWSKDFFENTMDHCESTQGVAVYQSEYSTEHSFRVMAFRKDWELSAYTVDARRTPRPLQPGDSRAAGKPGSAPAPAEDASSEEIDEAFAMPVDEDCPFGRRYRDAAQRLVSARVSRPALDLELSVYRDPLCFMHWNDIYLLDVRKGGKLVQTLDLVNYKGMQ